MIKILKDLMFVEDPRGYFYKGKRMQGITGIIGKRLNKNFPTGGKMPKHITDAADFGSAIHEDVEKYIMTGKAGKHPASKCVIKYLEENFKEEDYKLYQELIVTDKKSNATAIDIVAVSRQTGRAVTFDIKTGVFNREYCSWQMGIGNYMLKCTYGIEAESSFVISTKDGIVYRIIPKREDRVLSLLEKGRKNG